MKISTYHKEKIIKSCELNKILVQVLEEENGQNYKFGRRKWTEIQKVFLCFNIAQFSAFPLIFHVVQQESDLSQVVVCC